MHDDKIPVLSVFVVSNIVLWYWYLQTGSCVSGHAGPVVCDAMGDIDGESPDLSGGISWPLLAGVQEWSPGCEMSQGHVVRVGMLRPSKLPSGLQTCWRRQATNGLALGRLPRLASLQTGHLRWEHDVLAMQLRAAMKALERRCPQFLCPRTMLAQLVML